MKPIALDLFCCAGGAGEGLRRAGFDVIGVDIEPQPNYRAGRFVQADALRVLGDLVYETHPIVPRRDLAFVWASPPCQRHSSATRQTGKPSDHPDLIPPTRAALRELGKYGMPYVIENVLGAPLVDPIMLCGAMFDLGVVRHRLFECSWPIERPAHPKHRGSLVTGEYVTVAGNGGVPAWTLKERERRGLPRHRDGEYSLANWRRAMQIDWMERHELVESIPPAYAQWIGERALAHLAQQGRLIA